jgi:hypothetical protein
MTRSQAQELVAQLELDLDRVCPLCLCVVSFALEDGDARKVAGAITQLTPDLWEDGLDVQAFAAVEHACGLELPQARDAHADLERHGPRSIVAREIVRTLAIELSLRTRRRREVAMN